ncbi:GtrA family protein [Caballeronia sp. TF1N1]|uniref:GtrA family protein n=1 Tax=Caballeronia sp. TF1N1 TaxID=2878153 RepID=UPI001FD14DAE|nr:GtrA family protein [Caballeronia sp. TF1N1]
MPRQFLRFAVAGGIGFFVDSGVLYLALALGAGPRVGRIISFLCAAFVTWQINRRTTFERVEGKSALREWFDYLLAMSFGGVLNYASYMLTLHVLPPQAFAPLAAVAVGSIVGMSVNFATAKLWVYRKTKF